MALFGQNHTIVKLRQNVLVTLGINSEVILNILIDATTKNVSYIVIKAGTETTVLTAVETATGALVNTASKALKGALNEGVAGLKANTNTVGKIACASSKVASKAAGTIIIGVSSVFVALDAVDLAFNVRDLIEKKGCKAAPYLRKKAKDLESSLE